MLKKIMLALVVNLLLMSCTTAVYLRKSPSEVVLTSIHPVKSAKVSYNYTSAVPDLYTYENGAQSFVFDLNDTYRSNLRVFMNTKYELDQQNDYTIDYKLNSCNLSVKEVSSGMQSVANFLVDSRYQSHNWLLNTEIALKVTISKNGETVAEKTIVSVDEFNSASQGSGLSVYVAQQSFDQAIGKSIIMIDKFLQNNNL